MNHTFASPTLIALLSFAAFTQTDNSPRFEAADVHPSAPSTSMRNNFMQGPVVGGGRFDIRRATLIDLIRLGWRVQTDKITGGPDWTGLDRFDILAKAPAGANAADLRLMLQNLLADRLGLKVHPDTKPMPAFALTVVSGKKPRLKQADGAGPAGCKMPPAAPGGGAPQVMISGPDGTVTAFNLVGGLIQYTCRNISMAAFAEAIKGFFGANTGPNPVPNETGLEGNWDFDLQFSFNLNGPLMANGGERISFPDALEKQLGLKLETRQVPMPVIVIDEVREMPTPNPPNMTLNLPALPTEFEVADIKLTPPDTRFGNSRTQPGGRVNITGLPLQALIAQAWGLYGTEDIAGLPKSLESNRYDIVAKAPTYGPEPDGANAPAGSIGAPASQPPAFHTVDDDSVNLMLRNLLIERFGIKYHTEERPVTAFVLTVLKSSVKPKMARAEPGRRTGFQEGPGRDGKDPRIANPGASRLVSCENMTMKQFAENLPRIAGGYIGSATVYDDTGLEGAFDFTLNFSVAGMLRGFGGGGRAGGGAAATGPGGSTDASDPTGGISLYDAIAKQLGLNSSWNR